jgi:uncharacterized membrane protein
MDKRIGVVLVIIAIIIGAVALIDRMNTERLISEYANQTGSCYIGGTCLHEQTNTTFIMLSIAAAAIFIVGALIIVLGWRRKPVAERSPKVTEKAANGEEVKAPAPKLEGDHKRIYDILIELGGSVLQGELVEKSGINKVTTSRILDKLEMRGLVERRRHGMSNIVVLKKH